MQRYSPTVRTISISDAELCAESMLHAGGDNNHPTPNIKLAFAAAILSANNRLDRNGWQVNALRQYMLAHDGKLPTSKAVVQELTAQAGYMASINHASYIVELEHMSRRGELHELSIMPESAHAWLLWRESAQRIKGIGYKTASFAALLAWPFDSPLVPCDRHVVARLAYSGVLQRATGYTGDRVYALISGANSAPRIALYRMVERLVGNEKLQTGYGRYSTAIFHWARWSEWRMFAGAEDGSETAIESHDMLSAYWY